MAADLLITLAAHDNNPNNVTIAFTMGVTALKKGHKVELMLLSDAVHLAEKGYAKKIDIGEPFEAVEDLLQDYLEKGGKLKVCSSCMVHNGVTEENIIAGSEIIKADQVIDTIMESKKTLQLN